MVGKFEGILVGYRQYDKAVKKDEKGTVLESKPQYIYQVFCKGVKADKQTGLCIDECKVISIIEDEPVLEKMTYGMKVEFYGETVEYRDKSGNNQSRLQYSGIEAAK